VLSYWSNLYSRRWSVIPPTLGLSVSGSLLNLSPGCAYKTEVKCPNESFCCAPGATCSRDVYGAARCNDPNSPPTYTSPTNTYTSTAKTYTNNNNNDPNTIAAVTTSQSSSNNPLDNINPFKKGAAVPQGAVPSSLMAAVALLGAFFVSHLILLPFCTNLNLTQPNTRPDVGPCSREPRISIRDRDACVTRTVHPSRRLSPFIHMY
jgi:hypothetical protein